MLHRGLNTKIKFKGIDYLFTNCNDLVDEGGCNGCAFSKEFYPNATPNPNDDPCYVYGGICVPDASKGKPVYKNLEMLLLYLPIRLKDIRNELLKISANVNTNIDKLNVDIYSYLSRDTTEARVAEGQALIEKYISIFDELIRDYITTKEALENSK